MLYPEKEEQESNRALQKVPEYWISHERKIILFSYCELFIHMVFGTGEEMMNSVMALARNGYKIG